MLKRGPSVLAPLHITNLNTPGGANDECRIQRRTRGLSQSTFATRHSHFSAPEYHTMRISYHNHTTWSDGAPTLAALIQAARRAGLDELGVSDHYVPYPGGQQVEW